MQLDNWPTISNEFASWLTANAFEAHELTAQDIEFLRARFEREMKNRAGDLFPRIEAEGAR